METIFSVKYEVKNGYDKFDNKYPIKQTEEYLICGVDNVDNLIGNLLKLAKTTIGYNDWNDNITLVNNSNKIVLRNKETKKTITITHKIKN